MDLDGIVTSTGHCGRYWKWRIRPYSGHSAVWSRGLDHAGTREDASACAAINTHRCRFRRLPYFMTPGLRPGGYSSLLFGRAPEARRCSLVSGHPIVPTRRLLAGPAAGPGARVAPHLRGTNHPVQGRAVGQGREPRALRPRMIRCIELDALTRFLRDR